MDAQDLALLAFVERVARGEYTGTMDRLMAIDAARELLSRPCDECGGTGTDPGSLNEPEPCTVCMGNGRHYPEGEPQPRTMGEFVAAFDRRPMGRADEVTGKEAAYGD
jgi:hypothetical protein